jgi:CMP-N,N'-diacetyllegionaminic acid synthase
VRILAVIPARGGSKGIPRKNIVLLCDRPLIAYTIEAAAGAGTVDRTIVSTDDDEIANTSRRVGAEVRLRPSALAQDDTPTRAVLEHLVKELAAEGYHPDAVMTLQPTSPLRTARHIDEAAALFDLHPEADSLVSCIEVPHIFHPRSIMRRNGDGYLEPYDGLAQPHRRQDKEPLLARNGAAVYITRTERLGEFVFGGKLLAYMMDQDSSLDIDTIEDVATAERLLRART